MLGARAPTQPVGPAYADQNTFQATLDESYVRSGFTTQAIPGHAPPPSRAEDGLELNTLVLLNRDIFIQPVVQRYLNTDGSSRSATVLGFRSKLNF